MKLLRVAAVAALIAQAGVPAALAQGWAWLSMVRGGQTVAQAVAGQAPCKLCLKIRAAKATTSITVAPSTLYWLSAARRMTSPSLVALPLPRRSQRRVCDAPSRLEAPPPRPALA